MAISINKLSKDIQDQIIKAYQNNMSLREIENHFGATRQTVSKFLTEKGIKTTTGNHYRKYFHNFDFFENIDNEEKAYWLGFMFADGYIQDHSNRYGEDSFGIALADDSKDIIEKFKISINATNPILHESKPNGQAQSRLHCCSQKTVNDLISHGCKKQKTKILQPPVGVPSELIPHFIRGFFDGDGSLTRHQNKNCNHISYTVNFTTTYEMAKWLQETLKMGGIFKDSRSDITWYYTLGGNQQALKFCHYIYDNASIWMNRKYERYKELLNKYGESQGN